MAKLIIAVGTVITLFLAFLIFSPLGTVNAGERGVRLRFGAVTGDVVPEGLYWKTPLVESVKTFPVRTQTIAFDKENAESNNAGNSYLAAATRNQQDLQTAVIVNYHVNADKVDDIYKNYTFDTYESNQLEPLVRSAVKATTAQYDSADITVKRGEIEQKIYATLQETFKAKDAVVESIANTDFRFSKEYTQAIENKARAEQDALAAQNKLKQVEFEAQQDIARAKGKAEAIKVEAQALKDNPEVSTLRAIEKWDGKLPTYTAGGAVPFINVK